MRRFVLLLVAAALLLTPSSAFAVTVSRAELSGGQLRVEGANAAPEVMVRGTAIPSTNMALGSADGSGNFRVEASGFRSESCRVEVSDGGRTPDAEATLSGCTPSSPPPPPPPPPPSEPPPPSPSPPSSTCTITPETFADGNGGTLNTWYFSTTGCRTSNSPVRFNVVAGRIPPGTTLFTQGVGSGGITGRPTTAGLFTFTIRVRDQTGATDTESFTIRVNPPRPVVITNQSDALSPGTVGQFYCCGNLFADGGRRATPGRCAAARCRPACGSTPARGGSRGTPTTRGTFSFLVRATDSRGAFAERTFSITIS
jgi:hypothetical protein